jgi:hypothetical protein
VFRRTRPRDGEFGHGVRDPGRLVSFPSVWDGSEIGRVGFHEQTIIRYETDQIIVDPFLEGYDSTEGDVPAGIDCVLRECVRPGVTMENTGHAGSERLTNHCQGVVLCIAGVDDKRLMRFRRDRNLSGEGRQLRFSRRIVIMIVEATLPDRHGGPSEKLPQSGNVARRVKARGIVGVDARGSEDKAGIVRRALGCNRRCLQRLSNADNRPRARMAGARDYRVAVAGERCVREVGVAVDEV